MEALDDARPRRCRGSLRGLRTVSGLGASGMDGFKGVRPRPNPLARDVSPAVL